MNTSQENNELVIELAKADIIIRAMLNAMTMKQKIKVSAQLEASRVSPDGMTRANERSAVLAKFGTTYGCQK